MDYINAIKINTYEDAVSYISSIPRFADKDDFVKMQNFYDYLNPEENWNPVIYHVAGTNGKGSTCAYLDAIYREYGESCALFTSPHLVDVRERIRLDSKLIAKEEFLLSFNNIASALYAFNEERPGMNYCATYFAWYFFIAMDYYKRAKAPVLILEIVLGGRLDATNVVRGKSVAVITEIGLDHMEYLGDSKAKIACEKAGIIRENTPLVYMAGNEETDTVLNEVAESRKAPVFKVGRHNIENLLCSNEGIDFSYNSVYYKNVRLHLNTIATYQVLNAALAIEAFAITNKSVPRDFSVISKAVAGMQWPGRMEFIKENVVFDGAHNVDGVTAFLDSVRMDAVKGKRRLLFSAVTDKQADVELRLIAESGLFDSIGLTLIDSSRALSKDELNKLASIAGGASVYNDAWNAYEELGGELGKDDRLYVCGSLYLVGELKRKFMS